MHHFVEKYKKWLAIILGNLCLVIGLYGPALSSLLIIDEELHLTTNNTVFTGLGIILLWGEIVTFAKVLQSFLSNNKK